MRWLYTYISFIALVASLFIAASGVFVNVNAKGTPKNNVILLFIASVIANFIATTGSAMLFIRSYMRLNKGRLKAYHIVFFIFLVANVGGALTPIGDPPLFLGFLRGVPFFWTFEHVWFIWLPATVMILLIFIDLFRIRDFLELAIKNLTISQSAIHNLSRIMVKIQKTDPGSL